MAGKGAGCLAEAMSALRVSAARPVTQRTFARSMATEASSSSPTTATGTTISRSATSQTIMAAYNPVMNVPLTIHAFPSLEPVALEHWSVEHLYLPLRRDILQHAVVYEGDNTRQGTASTKNRYEVHGSHRKMRPQKGSGKSRMGTRQSPLLRGGGKTFGPRPRDFGTRLNRKEYDKAWRTALSYRYRRGELLVCEDGMDLPLPEDFLNVPAKFLKDGLREAYVARYMKGVLDSLGLGRPDGRTLFVTGDRRETLYGAMEEISEEGRALEYEDVDVKDLLEEGKVVMERAVLKEMIEAHQSDLVANIVVNGFAHSGPPVGKEVLGV